MNFINVMSHVNWNFIEDVMMMRRRRMMMMMMMICSLFVGAL